MTFSNFKNKSVHRINPTFKFQKRQITERKIEHLNFAVVFLIVYLLALNFVIFSPQIRIPCYKSCIYGQMLTKSHEHPVKLMKKYKYFTNLNVEFKNVRKSIHCQLFLIGFPQRLWKYPRPHPSPGNSSSVCFCSPRSTLKESLLVLSLFFVVWS